MKIRLALLLCCVWFSSAEAQMFRPPAFSSGIPGLAQNQAIFMQRHQARTLLYREALDELKKNPKAADVPECPTGKSNGLCLSRPEASKTDATPKIEGRRLAVLFGNNDYKKPIPELETPIADVSKTAEILKTRFGFETRIVKNASKAEIISALNQVAADAKPEDNVLLFYAGHGYLMDESKMGFWIPVDASVKTASGWISNTDISKLLNAIRARQLILISDSCFSGSLTREQKVSYSGKLKTEEILRRRSVLVLSSGGDEPVSDEGKDGHSIFAWNLIKTLDTSNGNTPGQDIWRTVHKGVSKEYPQEPQYGAVLSAGHHEGGEYFFQQR